MITLSKLESVARTRSKTNYTDRISDLVAENSTLGRDCAELRLAQVALRQQLRETEAQLNALADVVLKCDSVSCCAEDWIAAVQMARMVARAGEVQT